MKVSELADTIGVNPQTVRYYEREGLLAKPRFAECEVVLAPLRESSVPRHR
ncbi:MAG: MerR family DNA-binding transcriptional regulator [Verrucomicrobiae bacterium]|nr:MerR family DNA-binding transcriptional regulator [Verrucomicrobiae bacterium]